MAECSAKSFFAVESGFKGIVKGNSFHTRSIIHAPIDMTDKENGILSVENKKGEQELITAYLDNEKRKQAIKGFNPLIHLNPDFYKKIFNIKR